MLSGGVDNSGKATGTSRRASSACLARAANPQARNLFNVIGHPQKRAGLPVHVTAGAGVSENRATRYQLHGSKRRCFSDLTSI
jgi:hypothetical protein